MAAEFVYETVFSLQKASSVSASWWLDALWLFHIKKKNLLWSMSYETVLSLQKANSVSASWWRNASVTISHPEKYFHDTCCANRVDGGTLLWTISQPEKNFHDPNSDSASWWRNNSVVYFTSRKTFKIRVVLIKTPRICWMLHKQCEQCTRDDSLRSRRSFSFRSRSVYVWRFDTFTYQCIHKSIALCN